MRLTLALGFRRFRERYYLKNAKIFWRTRGKNMFVREMRLADEARERLERLEVEDTFTSTRYQEALLREIDHVDDDWKPPVDLAKLIPQEKLQEEEVLAFVPKSLFCLGERQAAVLTKSFVIHGTPPDLHHPNLELPADVASHLERAIMRANVWANDEDRLPRRFVPELPIWKPKPEFGILPKNQVRYLLTDLLRYAQQLTPLGLSDRLTVRDAVLPSSYRWSDEQRIHLEGALEMALFSRHSLPTLAEVGDEMTTLAADAALPDLGPVSPLVDLKATRKYTSDTGPSPTPTNYPHLHLGIVNLADLPYPWNYFAEPEAHYAGQEQKNAIGIMSAFGLALASARNQSLIKPDGCLIRPVTSQVVCCDGMNFEFIRFQLNSLDFRSNYEVKNLAWVDDGHALFQKNIPRRARLRNTTYHDLNLDVFRRFLCAFRFGLDTQK